MLDNTLLQELDSNIAKVEFLKSENYCHIPLPVYVHFSEVLQKIYTKLESKTLREIWKVNPAEIEGVNYTLYTNKDGKFSWRPMEIIHPAIYVELVKIITEPNNWRIFQNAFNKQKKLSYIERCSGPHQRKTNKNQIETEILNYWETFEQRSLALSFKFSVLHHTDIANFYPSIYTHSICWALHGKKFSKRKENKQGRKAQKLLGNKIDSLIRSGRNDETMGIPQGSMLMDFIAELILAYADIKISILLWLRGINKSDFHILRYRDDYRIFTNDTITSEKILRAINDILQSLRLSLGSSKTKKSSDLITGSIKPDKLAAIHFNDLQSEYAKTLQKQLLRIHNFSQHHPNSKRIGIFLNKLAFSIEKGDIYLKNENIEVCLAIITEIIVHSPIIFPDSSRILAILLAEASSNKEQYWELISKKISQISHTGIIDLHMQRIAFPNGLKSPNTNESFCKVIKEQVEVFFKKKQKSSKLNSLWKNEWLPTELQNILKKTPILSKDPKTIPTIPTKEEVSIFRNYE